jgi:hypothetical protein
MELTGVDEVDEGSKECVGGARGIPEMNEYIL